MSELDYAPLTAAAIKAREAAYARYSNFRVGAALLAADGRIFPGCNVENASYGLTQCAERTALTAAVCAGARQFKALVIVASGAITPCGACRQVLAEFCDELPIRLINADAPERFVDTQLSVLLPGRFVL